MRIAVALALAWHRQWQWRNSNSKTSYISSINLVLNVFCQLILHKINSLINITLRSVIYMSCIVVYL